MMCNTWHHLLRERRASHLTPSLLSAQLDTDSLESRIILQDSALVPQQNLALSNTLLFFNFSFYFTTGPCGAKKNCSCSYHKGVRKKLLAGPACLSSLPITESCRIVLAWKRRSEQRNTLLGVDCQVVDVILATHNSVHMVELRLDEHGLELGHILPEKTYLW